MASPSPLALQQGLRWTGVLAWLAAALPLGVTVVARGPASTGWRLWAALAAFALFGGLFWLETTPRPSTRGPRSRALALLVAQSACALLAIHLAPSLATLVLAVIVAAQLPDRVSPTAALIWLVALTAGMAVALAGSTLPMLATVSGVFLGLELFAFLTALLASREQRARIDLIAANAALRSEQVLAEESARRAERDRLAADLHDVLGHDLVALSLNLEAARRSEPAAAGAHLEQARELAATILDDVRALVRSRREETALDLCGALTELADHIPYPRIHLACPPALALAETEAATALRCAQEAVTNALRHAGASSVWIEVENPPGRLVVQVRDDGAGPGSSPGNGTGLQGMRERARKLGGTLEAGPDPRGGFRVRLEIPVRTPAP